MIQETIKKEGGKIRKSYSHKKADARKEKKRNEAIDRQAKYDALTITERIDLAKRNGGSKRELARLTHDTGNMPPPSIQAPIVEPKKVNKYKKKKMAKI